MKYEVFLNMQDILQDIELNKQKLRELLKNPANRQVMDKWLKTELTYTSNAIEGNTLTRKETALAIEEDITSAPKPINDYLEARNHAQAYEYLIDLVENGNEITEQIVLNIHKIILSGIDNLNAGFYRSVRVRISGSQTVLPNPLKVPELMDDFFCWLEKYHENPILTAIEAHYKLVTIHPFIDGNGRTARLLMNLILIKNGLAPIIIRPIDRKRYLSSIETRQIAGDSEKYTKFMLTALNRSLKTVIDLLNTANADIEPQKLMTIAKFAKLAGVRTSTIRYWMKIGKIKPVTYSDSGYALFSKEQIETVK